MKKRTKHNQQRITDLVKALAGQAKILTIPRLFIRMTGGDLPAALLLSQAIYWSDRGVLEGGWFWKNYAEWEEEIGLTKYQTSRAAAKLRRLEMIETKIKKAPPHGAPTVHYRPIMEKIETRIFIFLESEGPDSLKVKDPDFSDSQVTTRSDSKETSLSITETTPQTTQENPPATTREITDAYVRLLGFSPDEWANGESKAAVYIAKRWSVDQFERAYAYYKADRFWRDKPLRLRDLKARIPEFLRSLGESWASQGSGETTEIDPVSGQPVNKSLQLEISVLEGVEA